MSPGVVFERVYVALREELGSGRFSPGQPLEPALLAADLNSSITPVRDALHRLAGEELVQAPRHNGFRMPLLTESALRDLYGWNGVLLLLAAGNAGGGFEPGPDLLSSTDAFFLHLARGSRSGEQLRAMDRLNARLRLYRRAEAQVLAGLEAELLGMTMVSDGAALRRSLRSYTRRRQAAVPELLERLPPEI